MKKYQKSCVRKDEKYRFYFEKKTSVRLYLPICQTVSWLSLSVETTLFKALTPWKQYLRNAEKPVYT